MIVCKGCGGLVAKNAKACPKCGKPTPAENVQGVTTIVVLLSIAVGVLYDMSGGHLPVAKRAERRGMVERLRRDVPIFGIGLCLVALAYAAITIASALLPGALGVDLHSYQDAARSWLAGDGFYHARQLVGPYQIVGAEFPTGADVLYPPTLLWLLVPFTVLPDLLWWAIPAAMSAWALWLIRPSRWLWFGILALLVFPPSLSIIVRGNPAMWLAAFTLLGVAYGWGGAFVLLKPSLLPFALIGVTGRKWWLIAGLLAALTLPLLPLLSQYPQVVLDSRGGGLLYSLGDVPLLSIPALAWISSRSRPSEPRSRPDSP